MSLLRRLRHQLASQPPGEVATDDWAPVPVSATAGPGCWAEWLEEPAPPPPPRPASGSSGERPAAVLGISLVGHLDAESRRQVTSRPSKPAEVDSGSRYEKLLTREERAIIAQQKKLNTEEVAKVSPAAARHRGNNGNGKARIEPVPRLRAQQTLDKARIHQHLTAEEQAIIAAQQPAGERARTARRRPKTDEIMKDYGDHLTEEERRIIEQQLG